MWVFGKKYSGYSEYLTKHPKPSDRWHIQLEIRSIVKKFMVKNLKIHCAQTATSDLSQTGIPENKTI